MASNSETAATTHAEFEAGDVLFRQGELASTVFVINAGIVQLTRRVFREEIIVEQLHRGNLCGDVAFAENARYPVTATALEPVRAVVVGRDDVERVLLQHPHVVAKMAGRLATRLAHTHFRLSALSLRSTEARIMLQLHHEAVRAHALGGETFAPLPYDLPEVLACERGPVRETIRGLQRDGYIELDNGGRFRIVDREGYERRLSYLELRDRFDSDS